MAEVPEHLLQRSRERRIALGLEAGDAPAGDSASSAAPAAAAAASPATAAPTTPAAPAAPIAPEPPPPPRPRPSPGRVPAWIVPALAALPLWGFLYLGIFGERAVEGEVAVSGAEVYSRNCASCHGASGEGGVGPALADGASANVFPDEADHIEWVKTGSQPFRGQEYGAEGSVASGNMPGFEGTLSEEEIQAVVTYEREGL